jgi:hypothetical protein
MFLASKPPPGWKECQNTTKPPFGWQEFVGFSKGGDLLYACGSAGRAANQTQRLPNPTKRRLACQTYTNQPNRKKLNQIGFNMNNQKTALVAATIFDAGNTAQTFFPVQSRADAEVYAMFVRLARAIAIDGYDHDWQPKVEGAAVLGFVVFAGARLESDPATNVALSDVWQTLADDESRKWDAGMESLSTPPDAFWREWAKEKGVDADAF